MDPNDNLNDNPNPVPEAGPTPMVQPQNNFNPEPVQPGAMPPAPQQVVPVVNQTDTLGIISIVLIFFAPFIGVIIGAIGLKKANKEGYKNTLSKIGLIINSIFVVLGFILAIVWLVVIASLSTGLNDFSQEIDTQSQSANLQDPADASNASFEITSVSSIGTICEAGGWPSNATQSATGKVVGIYSNSSSYPDYYSSQYADLTEYEDVDYENPTIIDTVVCLSSVEQEPIETVTCKLKIDDVEVDALMYRRPFTATAYAVSSKTEIASFTVQPESDCPYFVTVNAEDNSFDARVNEESLNTELNNAL